MYTPSPKIKIALLDDHMLVMDGVDSLLALLDSRFEVCIKATSGRELIDKIAVAPQLPDICLLDINMPVMDGYDTMQALNARWPDIYGIALTMHYEDYTILRMLKCGARGYLPKTVTGEKLKEAILEVYSNGYYFSEPVLKKFPKIKPGNIKDHVKKLHSERELTFLSLCCSDLTYEEIAHKMGLSRRTIEKYCARLKDKYDIHSRIGVVMYALYMGIGSFPYRYMAGAV